MSKFSLSLAFIVIVGLAVSGNAQPARKRMAYYQRNQYYQGPQRMMYVQYVQPGRTHARSTQAASALVSGETLATGTYLDDCIPVSGAKAATAGAAKIDVATAGGANVGVSVSGEQQGADAYEAGVGAGASFNGGSVSSVAEAYPDENVPQQVEVEIEGAAVSGDESGAGISGVPYDGAYASGDVAADAGVGVGVAGAVPSVTVTVDQNGGATKTDDEAKVPREYNFETAEAVAPVVPSVEVAVSAPAPAPIAPVAPPARRYLPSNKKVYVELEQSAEGSAAAEEADDAENAVSSDAEEEDEEDTYAAPAPVPAAPKYPARVPNGRRPVVKKPAKGAADCAGCAKAGKPKPLPAGTFFPVDFGGTSGGAIAIANSFSTGEGGSATSHAIAYGSPQPNRLRTRPAVKRH